MQDRSIHLPFYGLIASRTCRASIVKSYRHLIESHITLRKALNNLEGNIQESDLDIIYINILILQSNTYQ